MKILKIFQPLVILITLTIHQIFFVTCTNAKMPFNISSLMFPEKTKDKKNERHLLPNITHVYNSKYSNIHNETKSSPRILFMNFFRKFFQSEAEPPEKIGTINTVERCASSTKQNDKNRLYATEEKKITPIVLPYKKQTKRNKRLKKFHRDFRHMHKKSLNAEDGSYYATKENEFFKHKSRATGHLSGGHSKKIDFSRNRFKRTTVHETYKPYVTRNSDPFDLSKEYSAVEYKIKDASFANTTLLNDYLNVTERSFLNFINIDYTPAVSSQNAGDLKENSRSTLIISGPINNAIPLTAGNLVKHDVVNFSSAVSEAFKSRRKRIIKWPIKRVVSVEGDVIIGGLMMVHSRAEGEKLCGPIMPQGGVQALEVMLYTIRQINKDPSIPFRIGAHILDDCDTDTYGLEMALDFIKTNLHYLDDGQNNPQCAEVTKPIWGVVGAPSSITSIQVSNLLRLFKIPMISPFSTSPELSNKNKYDYFCRTIPSDYYQVQVIVKIIDRLKWTYVSVIYEESNYGIKGLEELEKVLSERKICIAIKEKVLKDSGVPNEAFYDNVVAKLLTKPLAKGVIVFASDQEVAGIMRAVKRLNITDRFSWIGSDGWSARNLVSDGNEEVVEGTISVQPQAKLVKGFNEYFFDRTPSDHVNPYFAEFWETHFRCRLPFVPATPFNMQFNKPCMPNLRLEPADVEIENQLQFVHQATCGFCKALINMHTDVCGKNHTGICEKMWKNRGSLFLEYIRNVNFTDFSGDTFLFDKNGDGPARYNIVHYKQISLNVYKWIKVGKYEDGVLNLNIKDLQFKLNNKEIPASSCSEVCEKGQVKKYKDGDKCCWKCISCAKKDVVLVTDETECKKCVLGTKPNEDRTMCVDQEPINAKTEFYVLSITGTSGFGFFNVITTFTIYICNFNTAIVRASSREAQILILIGALFLHANAYSFMFDPDEVICSMQSYFSGIGYILIYGTLFWKSYRIVRIFDLTSHYKNMNSSAFVLLVLGLCCIQKIKSVIWTYFIDPRKVSFYYPNEDAKIKLCSAFTTLELGYFIGYIFPLISIICCYFRTKKITNTPKVFNDSPQIFFSIRFTIITWIAMLIMHFMTSNIPLRQNILALITNMNGIMAVFVLFYRSMFIILFRPQMNTREYLRASRANHTMKPFHMEESQQAMTKETISQLVMNEFSGECSYNNNDIERDEPSPNIRISYSNENINSEIMRSASSNDISQSIPSYKIIETSLSENGIHRRTRRNICSIATQTENDNYLSIRVHSSNECTTELPHENGAKFNNIDKASQNALPKNERLHYSDENSNFNRKNSDDISATEEVHEKLELKAHNRNGQTIVPSTLIKEEELIKVNDSNAQLSVRKN